MNSHARTIETETTDGEWRKVAVQPCRACRGSGHRADGPTGGLSTICADCGGIGIKVVDEFGDKA
jgi:DnaJ-class molecular chaperone